jgi:pseudomonalisin/xanthomonalisin
MLFNQKKLAMALAASLVVAAHAETWVNTVTHAHPVVNRLSARGDIRPSTALPLGQQVHIAVTLKVRNKADLTNFTRRIQSGHSHRYLSTAEFMQHYAPSDQQVAGVMAHLRQSGFSNIVVSPNHLLITADGSAGSVNTAFHTALHRFTSHGREVYANVSDAMVPQSLGNTVLAVEGLQTVSMMHTVQRAQVAGRMHTMDVSGHSPTDFSTIYDADGLPPATNTVIGIISEGDLTQTIADLNTFTGNAGFPQVNTSVVNAGTPTSDTSGIGEWNLDSQDALAAAGGQIKQMIFYVAPSMSNADITAAINKAQSDNQAKVVNVSLGECEDGANSDGMVASVDQILQAAVAQGQIFSVSTGDAGSDECGDGSNDQSYPAVSPYVMAIGGTTVDASGTSYNSESVWNGTGGGISSTESAPDWQVNSGVLGSSSQRGVPDVAFDADPASGANVLVNGQIQTIGGTSLAAPLFTGFWARIESANNNSISFPAASLYNAAANNPQLFHDVVSGSNGAWSAQTGWDYASGWGSIDIGALNSYIQSNGGF